MLAIRRCNIFLLLIVVVYQCAASNALQKADLNVFRRPGLHPKQGIKPDFLAREASIEDINSSRFTFARKVNLVSRRVSTGISIDDSYDSRPTKNLLLKSFAGLFLFASALSIFKLLEGFSLVFELLEWTSVLPEKLLLNYKNSMVLYPLRTKVATGASLAVLGDSLAQSREPSEYNPRRAASFAAFDACYRVFQHNAFPTIVRIGQGRFLGNILSALPFVTVGNSLKLFLAAFERTLLYQLVVIPLFYYPVFFTFTGFLQGLSLKETFQRAKANFLPCWKRNLMFWIPIQLIMFGLVDEKWQIPFVCLMGLIWSTILSVTAGKVKHSK